MTKNEITPEFCRAAMFPRYDPLTDQEREATLGACVTYAMNRLADDAKDGGGLPDAKAVLRGFIKLSLARSGLPAHVGELTYEEAMALSGLTGGIYVHEVMSGTAPSRVLPLQVASQKFIGLATLIAVKAAA